MLSLECSTWLWSCLIFKDRDAIPKIYVTLFWHLEIIFKWKFKVHSLVQRAFSFLSSEQCASFPLFQINHIKTSDILGNSRTYSLEVQQLEWKRRNKQNTANKKISPSYRLETSLMSSFEVRNSSNTSSTWLELVKIYMHLHLKNLILVCKSFSTKKQLRNNRAPTTILFCFFTRSNLKALSETIRTRWDQELRMTESSIKILKTSLRLLPWENQCLTRFRSSHLITFCFLPLSSCLYGLYL